MTDSQKDSSSSPSSLSQTPKRSRPARPVRSAKSEAERADRLQEIEEHHSENLRALERTTAALRESNDRLALCLTLPAGIRPDEAVDSLFGESAHTHVHTQVRPRGRQ
jgi:hypothetical protein